MHGAKRVSWSLLAGVMAVSTARAAVVSVTPGGILRDVAPLQVGHVTGTVLPVWNGPDLYAGIRRGLSEQDFRLFRFPNGSLSNEYHWNGAGEFDSVGIWHPDSSRVLPGFLSTSRYRGTSKDNYGASFHSLITDGDDSTFWWSDPLGGPEPWVLLELGDAAAIDSVRIVWGALRPDSVSVGEVGTTFWNGYRGRDGEFLERARAAVSSETTVVVSAGGPLSYLAIRPLGVGDRGVQIAEIRAWAAGVPATVNVPSRADQTPVVAMGAHPGGIRSTGYGGDGTPSWTFEMFMDYLGSFPGSEAMICVNYGTGTPEEAAAWVKHANRDRKLGIRHWEVGNEMDGKWEEGGPVDARQYARKFLAFSKAMKDVDSTILVFGPVQAGMTFAEDASGHLDGTSWTEEFLRRVSEAERADGRRYLDGFDFHAYPYWTSGKPNSSSALAAMRKLGGNLDTLASMLARTLDAPRERLVAMTEFNVSVVTMDLMMRPENATGIALMLGQLVEKFGGNAHSIVWDSYEGGGSNADGSSGSTWGALTLFVTPRSGSGSSIQYAPNSPYWGNWTVSKLWAIEGARPIDLTVSGSSAVEAHALTDGRDTSWLLLNLLASPCTTQVSANPASGWIFTFGKAQYAWNGTTADAFAFPNSGPSGRPIPPGWDGKLVIPAYGMVVVRNSSPWEPLAADHVVQFSVQRHELEFGDTLRVSGTVRRAAGSPAPLARLGDTTLALSSVDGQWDSPEEAFRLEVPSVLLGEGLRWLSIGQTDSVLVNITGRIRPVAWIDRFDDASVASDQTSHARWTQSPAGGAPSKGGITSVDRPGGVKYMRVGATLLQPDDLGYAVYEEARLNLDSLDVSASAGIQFDWCSWHSDGGSFALQIATDTVDNYDDYAADLPSTDSAWTTVRLRWSAFQQAGWGGVLTGPLLARQVNRLNFRAVGEGSTMFGIDNLAYLGTSGDSIQTAVQRRAPSSDWSVLRRPDGWVFQLPQGAQVRLAGLDGRTVAILRPDRAGYVAHRPKASKMLYAILESEGRREVRLLPVLR